MKHVARLLPVLLLLAPVVAFPLFALAGVAPAAQTPVVYTANVNAIIHPVSAEYMIETIDRANDAHAAAVVFTLATPGGLVDSTRDIISRMIASKTPVVVFVGPSGARAASAGFLLTIAADVAVMAPGTHIGAAHPVAGAGETMDATMAKKAAEDVAAYARTLAEKRGRNATLADAAVKESRAFTDEEALSASPPLIDFEATSVRDLLNKLDGRTVRRFDGSTIVMHTAGATIVESEMNWRQRVLSAIAHPNITYILFTLGLLGLTVELWNPGAVLPGVAGGICLLLAFFAFQVLPVNYAGILLILFGIMLFVLELKVASYGLLSAGGLIALALGSMILMSSPAPELRVSLNVILPVVLALSVILTFLVRLTIASQRRRPTTGASGMIGELGRATSALEPGSIGRVVAHGEIWRATSPAPVAEGDTVRITAVDGLTLTVRREAAGTPPPAAGDDPTSAGSSQTAVRRSDVPPSEG
jgi:membrane-bound serine protease (ClpP class)